MALHSAVLAAFLLLSSLAFCLCTNPPTQLRLAFAGPGGIAVSWTTASALTNAPQVNYGASASELVSTATGNSHTYGTSYFHDVVIRNLEASTEYYYQVVADPSSTTSEILSFTTARAAGDAAHQHILLIGDMGITNSADTFNSINEFINETDWIYHIGDISYADDFILEFETYEGAWNIYQNKAESFTSVVPYMVLPGNHEVTCTEVLPFFCPHGQKNFTAYRHRFRMPGPESNGVGNMWWSADIGLVHFVSINTETDFPNSPEGPGTYLGGGPFGNQLGWLATDLSAAADNRDTVPWIIVSGHRSLYSSVTSSACPACAAAFEALFDQYNVDLVFGGHVHWYERFYAIKNGTVVSTSYVNPPAPVYITNGAAGNAEGHTTGTKGSLSAFLDNTHYGYSFLDVYNSTTLGFSFYSAADQSLIDTFNLVKSSH